MDSKFSARLVSARKKIGITQKELAERINVAPSSLSAYEQKGKYPSLDVAARLADALDVSVDYLCGREKGKRIEGIPDIFKLFIDIARSGADINVFGDYFIVGNRNTHPVAYFGVVDTGLSRIFSEWQDMLSLYGNGVINDELYFLWLDKKLSDMEEAYCDDVGFASNDSDSEGIEDDELPY